MDLKQFYFPVGERQIAVDNQRHPEAQWESDHTYLKSPYKAIVREDTNEVISVVRDSYQLVRNEDLIKELLYQLATLGTGFRIDPTHSFVENARMRLQVTFPELKLQDSESDIALSLFVHNSYDMSEGVRVYFGAIRAICSNGMVFGDILHRAYSKHTKGFSLDDLGDKLEMAKETFPVIQHRIRQLERQMVTPELMVEVEKQVGKRLAQQVLEEQEMHRITQWQLLNRLTNWVSHDLELPKRARYQEGISKVFAL